MARVDSLSVNRSAVCAVACTNTVSGARPRFAHPRRPPLTDALAPPPGTPQKVALITGASQGMGAALVDAYRGLGYAVVANARSIAPSDDPGVAAVAGDIAEPATADRIVATAVERFGRVDTLINN